MYLLPDDEWGEGADDAMVAPLDLEAEIRARS